MENETLKFDKPDVHAEVFGNKENSGLGAAQELLGQETHEWRSSDGQLVVVFGRAKGLATSKIARILGPMHSTDVILSLMYRAILGIRTVNGREIPEPQTQQGFEAVMSMFGDEFTMDETFQQYVIAWQRALDPDTFKALDLAYQRGDLPSEIDKIASEAGQEHAKK